MIIKEVNGKKYIVANNLTQHSWLTGTSSEDCHPITAITGLEKKLDDLEDSASTLSEEVGKIKVVDNEDGTYTFHDKNGDTVEIKSGHDLDNTTIQEDPDGKLEVVGVLGANNEVYTVENFKSMENSIETLKDVDNALIEAVETISLAESEDEPGKLIFTKSDGESQSLQGGFPPDDQSVELHEGTLRAVGICDKESDTVVTYNDLEQMADKIVANEDNINSLSQEVDSLKGKGGFLHPHDFGTNSPTEDDLTDYALSQITNITEKEEIWDGTRVTNIHNNHTWILNNTQDTDPVVFEWIDLGQAFVSMSSLDTAGVVKSSEEDLEVSVNNVTGKMSVNGLSTKLEQIDSTKKDTTRVEITKYKENCDEAVAYNFSTIDTQSAGIRGNYFAKLSELFSQKTSREFFIPYTDSVMCLVRSIDELEDGYRVTVVIDRFGQVCQYNSQTGSKVFWDIGKNVSEVIDGDTLKLANGKVEAQGLKENGEVYTISDIVEKATPKLKTINSQSIIGEGNIDVALNSYRVTSDNIVESDFKGITYFDSEDDFANFVSDGYIERNGKRIEYSDTGLYATPDGNIFDVGVNQATLDDGKVYPKISVADAKKICSYYKVGESVRIKWTILGMQCFFEVINYTDLPTFTVDVHGREVRYTWTSTQSDDELITPVFVSEKWYTHYIKVLKTTQYGTWTYQFQYPCKRSESFTMLSQIASDLYTRQTSYNEEFSLVVSGTYVENGTVYILEEIRPWTSGQVAIGMLKLSDGTERIIQTGSIEVTDIVR